MFIGCNYWASNAGTKMWREWSEEAIISDLEILSAHGIEILRVFPLWSDFQPVIPILGGRAEVNRYMLEGEKEPENIYWLDPVMIDRFSRFCDLCEKFNIKIMVGLVTGWMSGRTFIPQALLGKNLLTDPVALLFEQRLVRGMVTLFKDKKAIYAWDLGNECYALSSAENEYVTANWTALITANIRACDNSRPVISGADNATKAKEENQWLISNEAEFCDMLVRHPYPFWSKYGYKNNTKSMACMLHATAQGKYFEDLGGKPCMIEEIGTMGPMVCSDNLAADFFRVNAISAWANNMMGFLWWCANEQTNLKSIPYTTNMCEIELGMIYEDRTPKPVLKEAKKMQELLSDFKLPKAEEDAVLIVSGTNDCWGMAYSSYVIAKQAGLNVRFATGEKSLPQSDTYILPSVSGIYVMMREVYLELKERVKNGATLYISNDDGILEGFSDLTGLEIVDSCDSSENITVKTDKYEISATRKRRYEVKSVKADVLAYDSFGIPVISVNNYGKGKVYYVNFPLERSAIDMKNGFDSDRYKIYREIFSDKLENLPIKSENPNVSITRHKTDENETIIVAINYSDKVQTIDIKAERVLYGNADIKPFDAYIFKM